MQEKSQLEDWAEAHTLEVWALGLILLFLFRVGLQAYSYYISLSAGLVH